MTKRSVEENEDCFRLTFDKAGCGMALLTLDGHWFRANRALCQIVGYTEEELIDKTFEDITHPHDISLGWDHARRLLNGENAGLEMEKRYRHRDGHDVWVRRTLSLIRDAQGKPRHFFAHIQDITEIKALQQKLLDQNAALMAETARARMASLHKSYFLANMSHELRTPLNGIIGFSELLRDQRVGPLNAQQAEFAEIVLNGSQHLLQLINDLLNMAKIEAGREDLDIRSFRLRDVMAEVSGILHPLLERKSIFLFTDIEVDDDRVELDAQKIKQVLYNLLSNAIKFTPAQGSIHFRVAPRGAAIALSVEDTGPGIAPDDLPRLFVEFEQLHPRSNGENQGTGLGLVLAKKFVELHHGTIQVESQVGHGTTFTVLLPRSVNKSPTL